MFLITNKVDCHSSDVPVLSFLISEMPIPSFCLISIALSFYFRIVRILSISQIPVLRRMFCLLIVYSITECLHFNVDKFTNVIFCTIYAGVVFQESHLSPRLERYFSVLSTTSLVFQTCL